MTVLETLNPWSLRTPQEVFELAVWCSVMAKQTDESTRRVLYRIKNECIKVLLLRAHWKHAIDVRGDTDRHRGLLSIGLRENPRRRLHFHEYWLPAA